jgi:DegV family protein with EDD domain
VAIKIVTDSTSYIPPELKSKYDISTISLAVSFGVDTYDEEDLSNEVFYKKMAQHKELPTSSQPSPLKMYELFEQLIITGYSIVGIFISSEMSGTYSTAVMTREMIMQKYPNAVVEIIDSRSNSMELGFAVTAAARAAQAGKSMEQVLAAAHNVIAKSQFLFVPDTLEYLRKGGRIGGAAAFLGSVLQIKPILTVTEGVTAVFGKVRTKSRAIQTIIETFLEDIKEKGLGEVAIHHINSETEGNQIAATIMKHINMPVLVCPIGPVVGLHVGPGSLGIVYYTKNGG